MIGANSKQDIRANDWNHGSVVPHLHRNSANVGRQCDQTAIIPRFAWTACRVDTDICHSPFPISREFSAMARSTQKYRNCIRTVLVTLRQNYGIMSATHFFDLARLFSSLVKMRTK